MKEQLRKLTPAEQKAARILQGLTKCTKLQAQKAVIRTTKSPKGNTEIFAMDIPNCEFCLKEHKKVEAQFHFKTSWGGWSDGCAKHWRFFSRSKDLGTLHGQRYVKLTRFEVT